MCCWVSIELEGENGKGWRTGGEYQLWIWALMGSEGWGEECMFRGGMEKKWYFKTLKLVWGKDEWNVIGREGCR